MAFFVGFRPTAMSTATGEITASAAASGDVDDDVDDGGSGGALDGTYGDDRESRGITCRVERR